MVKHGVLQGSVLGPLLFLLFINDIMKITNTEDNNNKSRLVLFADDTSRIITSPNPTNFIIDINGTFTNTNNWFKANLLSLNVEKTFLVTQWFVLFVLNIIHVLDWESICLIPNIYMILYNFT